jgi:hypothetical protein
MEDDFRWTGTGYPGYDTAVLLDVQCPYEDTAQKQVMRVFTLIPSPTQNPQYAPAIKTELYNIELHFLGYNAV